MRSLTESAAAVCAALRAAGYAATQGRNRASDTVVVRHVTAAQKGKLDAIANKVADPHNADLVHFQSYLLVTVRDERAAYLERKRIEKYGESVYIDGVLHLSGNSNVPLPGSDPYEQEPAA